MTSKSLVCRKALNQRFSWTPHFECVCSIAEIPARTRTFDWRLGVRTAPEKPRHVLIAFQCDRSGNQDKNPSLFDHLSATEVSEVMNGSKYPARDAIDDFKKHRYVEYNKMFTEFARDYYGLDQLTVVNHYYLYRRVSRTLL